MRFIELDTVESTNELAKEVEFEHGLCITALEQTKGRGRRGKSWLSERGKGLYLSVVLSPLPKPYRFSIGAGVAVAYALRAFKVPVSLKWPNDLMLNWKKLGGILCESTLDRIVVGVGLNLLYKSSELRNFPYPATSLIEEGFMFDRKELTNKIATEIFKMHKRHQMGDFSYIKEFERLCLLKGREVIIKDGGKVYRAIALGVDEEGRLKIKTGEKEIRLVSADVSVRFKNGS